jgi:gluconate 2-dehydrogenase gamma chain
MSDPIQDVSRRDLLRITLTTLGVSVVNAEAAQHVHQAVAEVKKNGAYKPKFFNEHEYKTLEKLADLIIPADEHSPGALAGGAPEFIDFLSSQSPELAEIYTGGLAWLDHEMNKRYSASFVAAAPAQQTAMLDLIAYRKNNSRELGPGIQFFTWVRNMTVDAFYTSKAGMDDLGYIGNSAMSEFHVPAEAIDYAVKRSGLG